MSILQAIQRKVFGYTSEERADIQKRWVAMVVDRHVEEVFTRLLDDDTWAEDEAHTPTSTDKKGS